MPGNEQRTLLKRILLGCWGVLRLQRSSARKPFFCRSHSMAKMFAGITAQRHWCQKNTTSRANGSQWGRVTSGYCGLASARVLYNGTPSGVPCAIPLQGCSCPGRLLVVDGRCRTVTLRTNLGSRWQGKHKGKTWQAKQTGRQREEGWTTNAAKQRQLSQWVQQAQSRRGASPCQRSQGGCPQRLPVDLQAREDGEQSATQTCTDSSTPTCSWTIYITRAWRSTAVGNFSSRSCGRSWSAAGDMAGNVRTSATGSITGLSLG